MFPAFALTGSARRHSWVDATRCLWVFGCCSEQPREPLGSHLRYRGTALVPCFCLIRFIKPPALMISRISGGYGLI
jgi:hypothetical protein